MLNFRKTRGLLFYLSVFSFFVGLPFILAFALGYKFNSRTLKFVKTGLIFVKTHPPGAKIYLNGELFAEKTPTSMQELIPGTYSVSLELTQHYSWKAQVEVEAGKVSRIDKVILFPERPHLRQLNPEKFSSFRLDPEKKVVYYLDQEKNVLYRSDLDADSFEDIATLPEKFTQINGWDVSLDQKKVFIFNQHQISVISFDTQIDYADTTPAVLLDYAQEKINNVFWHSDSYHLIVLTDKHVQVIESRLGAVPINLVKLNKESAAAFYATKEDALYFSDSQKDLDGSFYKNLYKLEISVDPDVFEKLIRQPFGLVKTLQKEERE